jgi:hypothetical protein
VGSISSTTQRKVTAVAPSTDGNTVITNLKNHHHNSKSIKEKRSKIKIKGRNGKMI